MFLIDDILFAPLKGMIWIAEKIKDVAEQELLDEGTIKQKLVELQYQFELDQIKEKEYLEREKTLLKQLEKIRKYREEHAK